MSSPRWGWIGRIPVKRRIAVGFVAAGVLLGVVGAQLTVSNVANHYFSPGSILVSADQRTLATKGTSCGHGALEVEESGSTVTIRVHTWRSLVIASKPCSSRGFTASLNAPLGSRHLVDGMSHAELPSAGGARILRPTYLPSGFIHRYDMASFPDNGWQTPAGWAQVYSQNDSYDTAVWITQVTGAVRPPPAGVPVTPVVVRGHPGTAMAGEIAWTEQGQLFTIRSVTYAYAQLSERDLLAIADGLR